MTTILAEISDKVFSLLEVLAYSTLAACIIGGIARLHRCLIILPLLIAGYFSYVFLDELRAPGFGEAVVHELEYRYILGGLVSMNLPFVVVLILLIRAYRADARRQRRQRYATGACGHCEYNLAGNESGVCPECGQVVARCVASVPPTGSTR